MEPASIRYKNPGAMWGSALAIKWGAQKRAVTLNDGTGQGNNIAVFPTYVQGICAQLDLWRSSPRYRNKRFADAIAVWSGGNYVESYIAFVLKRVPGMTRHTVMNDAFWRSPMGIKFLKAQAWHEAGKPYPAPDADWIEAQRRVFDGVPWSPPKPAQPPVTAPKKPAGAGVATGTSAVIIASGTAVAVNQGVSAMDIIAWIGGATALAVVIFIIGYRIVKGTWPWTGNQSQEPSSPLPQNSEPSSEQLSLDRSALQLAALQEPRWQESSVSILLPKRSAAPSRKTRTPRAKSSKSKPSAAKKSSPKRRLKSKP